MPYIAGPSEDARGQPTLTMCRVLLLVVWREAVPDIVEVLHDDCDEATAALRAVASPDADTYVGLRYLFSVGALRNAGALRRRVLATIDAAGDSPERRRLLERAEASIELRRDLLAWARGYRLTGKPAGRNGWLLQHALDILSGNAAWGMLGTGLGAPARAAKEFRLRQHGPPDPDNKLGPLARDFQWLVDYIRPGGGQLLEGAPHNLINDRVRSAAARARFDLPNKLRPPRARH